MSWYLIQTKPRQENLARINLERQGYTIYLPVIPIRRRRRGKLYTELGPMFPLYLFINLSDGVDDWGPLRSTIGVTKLVTFGNIPARVPNPLISTLKACEDSNGIQIVHSKSYQAGDKVRITDGPFSGYEAIIHSTSARTRSILLLKVVENFIKVSIDIEHLEIVI
jgi:transcriptional antiterminator RfaH